MATEITKACECGRGPRLDGNGVPDCCIECVRDAWERHDECVDCGHAGGICANCQTLRDILDDDERDAVLRNDHVTDEDVELCIS